MFCAFDGEPLIRLYGQGRVREPGDGAYEELRPRFPKQPGERAIVDVAVSRVASSCGFGVPRMELLGPREKLVTSAQRKSPEKLAEYRASKNARSIDRLPGLEPVPRELKKSEMKERR